MVICEPLSRPLHIAVRRVLSNTSSYRVSRIFGPFTSSSLLSDTLFHLTFPFYAFSCPAATEDQEEQIPLTHLDGIPPPEVKEKMSTKLLVWDLGNALYAITSFLFSRSLFGLALSFHSSGLDGDEGPDGDDGRTRQDGMGRGRLTTRPPEAHSFGSVRKLLVLCPMVIVSCRVQ